MRNPNLGAITHISPSGYEVELTEKEEREIVKEAMKQRLIEDINKSHRRFETVSNAFVNALGFAAGGLLFAWIVGRKK